jgi:hypothetical protein
VQVLENSREWCASSSRSPAIRCARGSAELPTDSLERGPSKSPVRAESRSNAAPHVMQLSSLVQDLGRFKLRRP